MKRQNKRKGQARFSLQKKSNSQISNSVLKGNLSNPPAQKKPAENISVSSTLKYLILSFVFPFVILGAVFALHRVYPFGDRQILVNDLDQQYYPFFCDFWHKLRKGTIASWSWTAGAGHDYIALLAYYLASPLNLLAFISAQDWLRETLTFFLLVKIGCAGLFTGLCLRCTFKQNSLALPVFSSLYALCAFTLGYYNNILWFDAFALLPLVTLGLFALFTEGKYRLYIISLALAVLSNYYMGLFICVFVIIAFFCQCIIQRYSLGVFLRKLGLTVAYSAIAIGMAAVFLIPSWAALQKSVTTTTGVLAKTLTNNNFFSVLGNFIAFTPPTAKDENLPNLYCGMISILLFGIFITAPKILRREKIVITGTVVFLLLCCNISVLSNIMHGFRRTRSLPFRFSFLVSFILVIMAYRAFLLTEGVRRRGLLVMGLSASLVLLAAVFGSQENKYIIASVVLCIIYLLLFYFRNTDSSMFRQIISIVLFLVILTELFASTWIAVKTVTVSDRNEYPDRYEQIQALLDLRQPAINDFYRTEVDQVFTVNDPSLYNYNGISFFSSTNDSSIIDFMQGLGLGAWDVLFIYNETTPFINMLLNMRYMITCGSSPLDKGAYWNAYGKAGDSLLLENKYYLPLGFMVNENITGYVHESGNPFKSQNDLFHRVTGLDGNLFTITELTNDSRTKRTRTLNTATWYYEMPSDGMLYAYCKFDKHEKMAVSVNGAVSRSIYNAYDIPYVSTVGNFVQGDIIAFTTENRTSVSLGYFDPEIFEQGYALLAGQVLNLTEFTDTEIKGHVTAHKDGILYTSIPGNRNWNVFVDGVKEEILLIDNAMAAICLNKGTHSVEFRYFNKSFMAGIIISLAFLLLFLTLIFLDKRKPNKH